MDSELSTLYSLKDKLAKAVEDAIKDMPEKQRLDDINGLIASWEGRSATANKPASNLEFGSAAPENARTLASAEEKERIIRWVDNNYKRSGNKPVKKFKDLTGQAISEGVKIPGDSSKQVFVVSGIITKSSKYKKTKDGWISTELAA